ncbi:MAG TPA: hypothetical protein VM008_22150 [Phycisphaerae bacterium]|nr:hypothetical protein [Phycisphaerae bacterium]
MAKVSQGGISRQADWQAVVARQAQSGLSIKAFCTHHTYPSSPSRNTSARGSACGNPVRWMLTLW